MSKILFILKRREDYNSITHSSTGISTGLYNSASFITEMLELSADYGLRAKIVVVTDNNDIDREVTLYKPTHVIIEALWVVPSKFSELQTLHPSIKWIIRLHSEMPFMSNEGIAMDWIAEYSRFKNVIIATNALRMQKEIQLYLDIVNPNNNPVIYLPNYYPQKFKSKEFNRDKEYIDIGCFGAIRPLKNTLLQAIAALEFADENDFYLRFHINSTRVEMKGEPHLHNLKGMFEQLADAGHQLINHSWTTHDEFLNLCGEMDIGMQVSFSETFNIVACDFLSQGVPIVGSSEMPWISSFASASPTESKDIVKMLDRAYTYPKLNTMLNIYNLKRYTNKTRNIWIKYFINKD